MATPALPDIKNLAGATNDEMDGGLFSTATPTSVSSVQESIRADVADAEAAKVAAQVAQAASESAASNSASSATNSEASSQASQAAQAAAETAQTAAETAETNAETAETNAASSAAAAATSATNAATSETNAATSATNAATSETNAASSATAANTAKLAAQAAQTAAETAETNAATSESNAATSETNAATSETNAANSATAASQSATSAATSAANALTSENSAQTYASNALTYSNNAASSATSANSSEANALTYRNEASAFASNASTSATNAATSATNAAASYDTFDDRYLGAKATAPTVDNDGDALQTGALYFNTTNNRTYLWNGSSWQSVSPDIIADTTPQLGADLDVNGFDIVSVNNGNIDIIPNGTGEVNISKVDIDAGTIDGTIIGATSAAAANFTTVDTTGDVVVGGNLTVNGTQTVLNTATLSVDDINITIADGAANAAAANGAGITVDGANATLTYASTGDKWSFNKPLDVNGELSATSIASTTTATTQSAATNNTTIATTSFAQTAANNAAVAMAIALGQEYNMANSFKSKTDASIGTSAATIYTCPASTETTIIGLTVANRHTSQIEIDVELDGSTRTSDAQDRVFIVKDAPVPVGSSLVVVGGDQKVVLEPGDTVKVTSNTALSADAIVSVLEIT